MRLTYHPLFLSHVILVLEISKAYLWARLFLYRDIDTDVGKTVATGIYAKKLMEQGFSVITQKMIQTGCKNIADDLLVHRNIQGIDLTEEDLTRRNLPYLFEYPVLLI